jgi:hypothetical protein
VKERGVLFLSPPLFLILFSAFLFPRHTDLPFTFPCIPTHPILVDLPCTCRADLPSTSFPHATPNRPVLSRANRPTLYLSFPCHVDLPYTCPPPVSRPTLYLSSPCEPTYPIPVLPL